MENRIKGQQLDRFAGRVICATMRANQVRLRPATVAYLVLRCLRQYGLAQTELAAVQAGTLRLKLLELGAVVRASVRRNEARGIGLATHQVVPQSGILVAGGAASGFWTAAGHGSHDVSCGPWR